MKDKSNIESDTLAGITGGIAGAYLFYHCNRIIFVKNGLELLYGI